MTSEQQVLWITEAGGRFQIAHREVPRPGPGFVLIKIEACALNPVDNWSQRTGILVDKYPYIAGNDGSGIVEEVGEGVSELKRGDRVFFQAAFGDHRGTFQQYVLVDVPLIAKIPDNLTFDQASTIPLGFATAAIGLYQKKRERGGVELVAPWADGGRGKYAGQAIYIPGGASSVGQYAIQLAKLSGFNPIITTASAKSEAYCRDAGATHVIDYKTVPYTSIPAVVKEIANGPVGIVYDAISTPESQRADWEVLRPNGSLVLSLPSTVKASKGDRWVVWTYGAVRGYDNEEFGREMYGALPGLLADGSIKSNKVELIEEGLKGIPAALERLGSGKVSGVKLVARPGELERPELCRYS
ncbi:GroES-like protein [Russula earlei]|uniref:GroES-like protein n=1 Tax=Russula earlei TaxID=71964 RepID=A0ACC0TTT3_9AGAM|nr:GroES-like protein [Russula earlei]